MWEKYFCFHLWHFTAAAGRSQPALLYATLNLLCNKVLPDSLSLNYTLWSISQVWIIHEVKSGHCNQILLLLHPILHFFLCRTSSPCFSSLRCTFLLIPSWGSTTTKQDLINTCADWGMKWPLCPEPTTSHIPAFPCTFKKLYLKTEHFHLPFFIQVLLWLMRISPLTWCSSVVGAWWGFVCENNEWIL